MLGFKGHVFRVEGEHRDVAGQLGGQREISFAAVRAAQVELVKLVAHNLRAPLRGAVAGELVVEKLEPAAVNLFRFGRGAGALLGIAIRIGRYTKGRESRAQREARDQGGSAVRESAAANRCPRRQGTPPLPSLDRVCLVSSSP